MPQDSRIGMRELVRTLRHELQAAVSEGKDDDLRFRVDSIELELKVTATRSAEAGGGVEFWVFDASAKGSTAREDTQTVKLALTPVSSSGGETLVGRRRRGSED